jgi:hypothetical protein
VGWPPQPALSHHPDARTAQDLSPLSPTPTLSPSTNRREGTFAVPAVSLSRVSPDSAASPAQSSPAARVALRETKAPLGDSNFESNVECAESEAEAGAFGARPGGLGLPIGVHAAPNAVYVCDWQNHQVQMFSASGTFLRAWGSKGSGEGQFLHPGYVCVSAAGSVYVTDGKNQRVQQFDSEGKFVRAWGSAGKA